MERFLSSAAADRRPPPPRAHPLQLPNGTHFLDATAAEALASPSQLLLFVTGKGDVAGMRFIGNAEVGVSDIKRLTEVRLP